VRRNKTIIAIEHPYYVYLGENVKKNIALHNYFASRFFSAVGGMDGIRLPQPSGLGPAMVFLLACRRLMR
jgi:hypothetical protein